MKHSSRFLTLALAAVLLVSVAAPALAADKTTVFIPHTIDKLGLPERPAALSLKTETDRAVMKDQWGNTIYKTDKYGNIVTDYNGNYIPVYGTDDNAVIHVQFSQKPDWAYIVWPEGNENLECDDTGHAEVQTYGHLRQPGTWVWNDPNTVCDPLTGEIIWRRCAGQLPTVVPPCWGTYTYNDVKADALNVEPAEINADFAGEEAPEPDVPVDNATALPGTTCPQYPDPTGTQYPDDTCPYQDYETWYQYWLRYYQYCVAPETAHVTGGDYAYMAGKGDVAAQYGRSGKINYIEYTVQKDFFRTGMDGAYTVIRYEPVTLVNYNEEDERQKTTVWYISRVTATYPSGNYIVGVEADYRNDKPRSLASYRITYETKNNETYKITYSPSTNTMLQAGGEFYDVSSTTYPSTRIAAGQAGVAQGRQGKVYLLHHVEDEVLCGEYYAGNQTLMSGSGKYLKKWYKYYGKGVLNGVVVNNNGRQVKKKGLKACTSFVSPRVAEY